MQALAQVPQEGPVAEVLAIRGALLRGEEQQQQQGAGAAGIQVRVLRAEDPVGGQGRQAFRWLYVLGQLVSAH
jgi:hypothetical protein